MPLLPLYTVVTTFDPLLTQDLRVFRALEPQLLAMQLALTNKQCSKCNKTMGLWNAMAQK
jgi:hypothetical protein